MLVNVQELQEAAVAPVGDHTCLTLNCSETVLLCPCRDSAVARGVHCCHSQGQKMWLCLSSSL